MSALFQPIQIGALTFPNRIAIAPMCQYSADDGSASDWHLFHWMNLAMSGAGMVTFEMTDVERRGRISHGCHGLYTEHNTAAAKRALDAARAVAAPGVKFGVQLAHAGRKASCQRPWEGGGPLQTDQDPWETVSASPIPFDKGYHTPRALEEDEILEIVEKFAVSAQRAERAGFDFLELHGAHGYLLHQFLSPLANERKDRWGGSLENRMRFIVEVVRAVRKAVPSMMLGVRLSVKDWVDGGFDEEECVEVVKALMSEGVGYICCSSGGISPLQKIPSGPGYQVHLAEHIRKHTGATVRAVGMIDTAKQAEEIVQSGRADMVAVARAVLADSHWPLRVAVALGEPLQLPLQYERSAHLFRKWSAFEERA
ncbi:MAG: NADH:flavin oxidoreductase/NADH oxidase [Rhizobiaceae bacterium]|nr:NADH:flavin oxidoreductase/NADH oxidase [Rhizobiaceae bacterium]